MYKTFQTKNVLNENKSGDAGWFWSRYSAFPYAGCQWGCEYCYLRDNKYSPHKMAKKSELRKYKDPFSELIKVKENAPELLRKALKGKKKDVIYLDNYQPVENEYKYVREFLKIAADAKFPVFINEKSNLVLNDIDILEEINSNAYLNIGWSIISHEDNKQKLAFEPKAPSIESRFKAMEELSNMGILNGTVFMPILPYIFDNEENIEKVIKRTKDSGGQYILDAGLTLWGYCGVHFYKILEKYDETLVAKYKKLFEEDNYAKHYAQTHEIVREYCKKYKLDHYIKRPISHFPEKLQLNKKIAANFYLQARELQMSNGPKYKQWAYMKVGKKLDELEQSIADIYEKEGVKGILNIEGIGDSSAEKIIDMLRRY